MASNIPIKSVPPVPATDKAAPKPKNVPHDTVTASDAAAAGAKSPGFRATHAANTTLHTGGASVQANPLPAAAASRLSDASITTLAASSSATSSVSDNESDRAKLLSLPGQAQIASAVGAESSPAIEAHGDERIAASLLAAGAPQDPDEKRDEAVDQDDILMDTETQMVVLKSKITINPRGMYQIPVTADAGCTLTWELQALDIETHFSVMFVPATMDSSPPTVVMLVEPELRLNHRGSYPIPMAGNLVFRADNRDSVVRGRDVRFIVKAAMPTASHAVKVGVGSYIFRPLPGLPLSSLGMDKLSGNFSVTGDKDAWSQDLRTLVNEAMAGFDVSRLIDYHTHVAGVGQVGTGCMIGQFMMDPIRHPLNYMKMKAFMSAFGVESLEGHADQEVVDNLKSLIQRTGVRFQADGSVVHGPHGRSLLLAYDMIHRLDGSMDLEESTMYVPNDYVYLLSKRYPEYFIPTCSVHPYRTDAIDELKRCAARGIRVCKWLPNCMHIDPDHPKCEPFYDTLAELGMILLSHVGVEHSVSPPTPTQENGNPLRLRRALDRGVTIIMSHCGTEGTALDLDDPDRPKVSMFDLWQRMMDNPKYHSHLFADISAVIAFQRVPCLRALIDRTDLHSRLIYGSDYPLPCMNFVVHTGKLVSAGLITDAQRTLVNELYQHNPLLFDIVVKRIMRGTNGSKFADSIFQQHPALNPLVSKEHVGAGAGTVFEKVSATATQQRPLVIPPPMTKLPHQTLPVVTGAEESPASMT